MVKISATVCATAKPFTPMMCSPREACQLKKLLMLYHSEENNTSLPPLYNGQLNSIEIHKSVGESKIYNTRSV